jgi:hypothetical protein
LGPVDFDRPLPGPRRLSPCPGTGPSRGTSKPPAPPQFAGSR